MQRWQWIILGALAVGARPSWAAEPPAATEFFERQVRPVLVESCFSCHGAASRPPMGGLRLDSREALLKGGSRGVAVAPGEPERSLLLRAIRYTDRDLQMPPGGRLADEKINALALWVRQGAVWPQAEGAVAMAPAKRGFDMQARRRHWAFQPLRRPALPPVRHWAWPRSPIDRFLLAKLEAGGLSPAPPADRRALLRRVTFDLIGLPPTPAELAAFLTDRAPNAYAKVVDRLLASPHYGERWARHWLDLVRFAETDGHELDFEKPDAFEYRDYVIRAFNADVPYDQFVTEQVAGDLLPRPRRRPTEGTDESVIGTGFWFMGEGKHSPVDLREDEAERIDNQIDVFGKTFLGLTVGCARCHDHKFDAISTRDYYALSGFLKSSRYQHAVLDSPLRTRAIVRSLATLDARLQPLQAAATATALRARLASLTARLQSPAVGGEPWRRYLRETAATHPDDPLHPWALLAGDAALQGRPALLRRLRERAESARRAAAAGMLFEAFDRDGYPGWSVTGAAFGAGPGRRLGPDGLDHGGADSGCLSPRLEGALRSRSFTISKRRILYHLSGREAEVRLIIDGFQRITNPIYGGLKIRLAETPRPTWFSQEVGKWIGHRAYIEIIDPGAGWIAVDRIVFSDDEAPVACQPLSLALLEDPAVSSPAALAEKYRALLAAMIEQWGAGRLDAAGDGDAGRELLDWLLRGEWSGQGPAALEAEAGITALPRERQAVEARLPEPRHAPAMAEGTPEDDRVHVRGSTRNLGEVVRRRYLEACGGSGPPGAGSGRLELARRLVATPLLARVLVNRLWQHHFGAGLVRTPDDFGVRGEPPTHPELLDYLAGEFKRGGWSIKRLQRLMLLSAAYQMGSRGDARAEAIDPRNRLLHRMPVRRLEAEAIRDAILAVSGRLDRKQYGPGVLPYLTPFMAGRGRPARSGPLDGDGRRSVYLNVRRNFLPPMFLAFDFPLPVSTVGRRSVSSVPAQALALMNNPFVAEQAGVWARRVLAEPDASPEARLGRMYVTAFARPPAAGELTAALQFLREQDARYGETNDPRSWSDLCHVLFNVKEFIFVE